MKWDQEIFIKNILWLVENKCNGTQKKFNDIIGRDSASKWKHGSRPSLEILLKISEEFDCSLDWLLTGKESQQCETPPDLKPLLPDLEYIYKSGNKGVKNALTSNIKEFKNDVEKDDAIQKHEQRLEKLEAKMQNGLAVIYDLSEKNRRLKNENVELKKSIPVVPLVTSEESIPKKEEV